MGLIGEIDPRHIVPFARVHYHDGFDAFGMRFDGLGSGGQADRAIEGNRLNRGKLEVLHLHGEVPFYRVGEEAKLSVSGGSDWVVEEIADLGIQEHEVGLLTTHERGFVFLVRAIAEEV